jgi:hypothetical protein
MANANGWGDGASNNNIGWGQGANNAIGWGDIHADSWAGATDIVGITTPPVDPDAQAFITAAAITDPTQQSAINTLVVDLKGYSIWSKMKALYPFVGGTASAHKFNLKDPRDLDAAFRLVFFGGGTHSVNGYLPNGTNAYADTKLDLINNTTLNSTSYGVYSRTNSNGTEVEIGAEVGSPAAGSNIFIRFSGVTYARVNSLQSWITFSDTDSRGFYISNRTASNVVNVWRNNVKKATGTTLSLLPIGNVSYTLGVNNNASGTKQYYSTKEQAFAFIGDGLTDTEAANFYTAVQAFQTTLGRSIGTQTVSDADAQAFVTAADIQDQVEANAINNLVIGMKADGLWTKMKAVYPFVGGTATSMKWNLKDPRDLDAAFRLLFIGGGSWDNNGYTPNGSNGYADTKLIPNNTITNSSGHLSVYSRTNLSGGVDMGSVSTTGGTIEDSLYSRWTDNKFYANYGTQSYPNVNNTDSRGLFITNRNSATNTTGFKNGSKVIDTAQTSSGVSLNIMPIGAYNNNGTFQYYSNRQYAFASIGNGLTDAEAANFYTRVQNFNTALARQV